MRSGDVRDFRVRRTRVVWPSEEGWLAVFAAPEARRDFNGSFSTPTSIVVEACGRLGEEEMGDVEHKDGTVEGDAEERGPCTPEGERGKREHFVCAVGEDTGPGAPDDALSLVEPMAEEAAARTPEGCGFWNGGKNESLEGKTLGTDVRAY